MSIKLIVTQCINGVDTLQKVFKSSDLSQINKEIEKAQNAGAGFMVKLDTGIDYRFFLHSDLPYEVNGTFVSKQKGELPYDEDGDFWGYEDFVDNDFEYQNYLAHPHEYFD